MAPERTCVACRRTAGQAELRRFALTADGAVVPDDERRRPGRGAYACGPDCVAEANRRRAWARAFRRPVSAPPTG